MTKIRVAANGPYLLSGIESITRMFDRKAYALEGNVALCRCGGSKNKPFCDGTHKRIGFSGDKQDDRTPDELEDHAAPGITIHDNRGACAHAGACTNGSPAVFRLRKEPFVDASGASPDEIAATIKKCPSGALSYTIDGTACRVFGGDQSLGFAPNGPYVLRGGVTLEGAELPAGATTDHLTLCRCGKSKNKPFCNGAHWGVQFDEDAPKQS